MNRKHVAVVLAVIFGLGSQVFAQGVVMNLGLDQDRVLAGSVQRAYLKVGLVGRSARTNRPPLNLSLVLDRSGSMSGDRIARAREAAIYAVNQLQATDIVSVVVYDDEAQVLVPATKVRDRAAIIRAIRGIEVGGSTALFAGVSMGAGEVRRFVEAGGINRVILLSDGMANVGPSSTGELARLGSSLRREGISVSTIGLGLGYNEDLMARLAQNSDGNHAFVENARDLAQIFDQEFRDAMSVVASNVNTSIEFRPGIRPIRIMNRDGDILGQSVRVQLNQVLGTQEKYVIIEFELPAGNPGITIPVATATTTYMDLGTRRIGEASDSVSITYEADESQVAASVRREVKEQVILQIATEANELAVELADQGKIEEAKEALESNAEMLDRFADVLASPALRAYADQNAGAAASVESEEWDEERKSMRDQQLQNRTQRSY